MSSAVAMVLLLAIVVAGCSQTAHNIPAAATISVTPVIPLSDRELAEKAIADAEEQIGNVDREIGWFNGNISTKESQYLPTIIAKREISFRYLTTAKDEFANGNYEQARDKAQDAFNKASETYNDALREQEEV